MSRRINTAKWLEKYNRWQIKVSKDGVRRTFTDPTPGIKGQIACNQKADAWLDGETTNVNTRISKIASDWIDELRQTTSFDHYRQYNGYITNYINPKIGNKKAYQLTEQDLQNSILWAFTHPASGKQERLSYKTLKNIKNCICSLIKYMRKCGVTTLYPENLYIPKTAQKSDKKPLQPDDLRILFSTEQTFYRNKPTREWFIHAFRFALITGLRPGELTALEEGRDICGNICAIHDAINIHGERTGGKTKNAIRTFIIPKRGMTELEKQRKMLRDAGIISPYVFPGEDGDFLKYVTYYKHWVKFRDFNKIDARTLYEIRHTFFAVNKRIPEPLIKIMGGHGRSFKTFDVYGGELDGEAYELADMVDANLDMYLK